MGYQVGGAIAPLLAVYLQQQTGGTSAISSYIIIVSVVAIACTLALTETYRTDLEDVHS